jgi:hypothetical protein
VTAKTSTLKAQGDAAALTELDTIEVSLVTRGANGKTVAFTKAAEQPNTDPQFVEVLKSLVESGEIDGAEAVETIVKDTKLSSKGADALRAALKIVSAFRDEAGMPAAFAQVVKMSCSPTTEKDSTPGASDEPDGEDDEDAEVPQNKKRSAKMADAQAASNPPQKAELPAEVRAQVDALQKAHADAQKQISDLQSVLKAERDERVTKEFVTKAEKDFAHVPGKSAQEIGAMLKTLNDIDPKLAATQMELLAAIDATISKSAAFREVGIASSTGADDAYVELQKVAVDLQKSDPALTRAKALVKAQETRPELYQAYLNQNPAQGAPKA